MRGEFETNIETDGHRADGEEEYCLSEGMVTDKQSIEDRYVEIAHDGSIQQCQPTSSSPKDIRPWPARISSAIDSAIYLFLGHAAFPENPGDRCIISTFVIGH